jgi:hypothetical protein
MTLRKALWASPLAVVVAVLVHVVIFGFAHAPGAGHAGALLGTLAATLAAALLAAFAAGFVTERPEAEPPGGIASAALFLAAAGAAAFGVIELSEGHLALPALIAACLAAFPVAYIVLGAARSAAGAARGAGARLAAFAGRRGARVSVAATGFIGRKRRRFARATVLPGTLRGRAPPSCS